MTAARAQSRPGRNPMLAKVHIAAKELGLKDEPYRDALELVTGQRTAAGLTDRQLESVLDHFKTKGWKPKLVVSRGVAPAGRLKARPADHPVARKARALWISLHQLGVVEDASEAALEAFAKRQLRCERLQWANQRQGSKLIEALKAMAERDAGWSQEGSLDEIKARLAVLVEARRHG